MNPLQRRLASLRRRLRSVTMIRGLSLVVIIFLGCGLAAGWLDWTLQLPPFIRAVLLLCTLGGTLAGLYWYLFAPLSSKTDDLALALQIENEYPVLNDSLASTVQFMQQTESSSTAGSPALRKEAIGRALRMAQGCDFNRVINTRGLRTSSLAALGILAVAGLLFLWYPAIVRSAALRLAHPFGEHDWPTQTQLQLDYPKRVATGQRFEIKGTVTGVVPKKVIVRLKGYSHGDQSLREYTIKKLKDGTGSFTAKIDLSDQQSDFQFFAVANDARAPRREGAWLTVDVDQPPRLIPVDGVPPPQKLRVDIPSYTELPTPEFLAPGTKHIEAIEGSWISLEAHADRPLKNAWIRFRPTSEVDSRKANLIDMAKLNMIGLTNPFNVAGSQILALESRRKVPVSISKSGKQIAVKFRPWLRGTHVLHIEDRTGLYNEYEFNIVLYTDPRPVVTMDQPATNRVVLPNAEINLQLTAEDEKFGLKSAFLEYWRKDKDGRVLGKVNVVPFFTPDLVAEGVTAGVADADGNPIALPRGEKLRPRFLTIDTRWSLDGLVKEGDILVIRGGADDYNDVTAFNAPGYSREVELTIVGKSVLNADLDAAQAKIKEKIGRLKELQEAALKNIKDVEKKIEESKSLDPEHQKKLINKLQDAQQWQKDMEKIIGKEKTEGLLKALQQLEQVIKDNKIESSDANDRVKLLKNELSKLEKEHLQLIGPELNNAKQKINSIDPSKEQDGKKLDDSKKDLDSAKEHQKKSLQKLEDLVNHLEKWGVLQELRLEAQKLLKEQIKVRGESEKLKDVLDATEGGFTAKLKKNETKVAQNAEQQQRLATDAKRFLDKLRQKSEEKKESSPEVAKMLNAAAQIALELDLHGEMNNTEVQIRGGKLNLALKQQRIAISILEQIIETLTEEREDQLQKLIQDQTGAQKELKEIVERLEKLQKKIEEANKIDDPKKREEALKALAEEQKKLTEQAEEKARELAMLRANEAGQAMNDAAQKLNDAQQKLNAGEDPQDEQKKAMNDLKNAQKKLDDAKKEAENELAREKLAKIADEIKGLKDRHDTVQAQTGQFHKLILQGGWTNEIQGDFSNHSQVQDTLSKETSILAQKLAGAKVFELILRKAGHDMKKAANKMEQHILKNRMRLGLFPLPEDVLEDEKKASEKIAAFQTRASDRLQSLLDALEAAQKMMAEKQEGPEGQQPPDGEPGQNGGGNGGGVAAQDGIPPMAQLKALKSEQMRIYERTRALDKEFPNNNNLPPDAVAERDAIYADQEALFGLFREIAGAANDGGQP